MIRVARMLRGLDRAERLWRIPILGREKGRLVRRLIAKHGSRRAVEIGSLLGYSAILIADALGPRGRLTCIEVNDLLATLVESNVERAGLERRVRVVRGDALRAIPVLRSRWDFALIDAVKEDYLDYLRQLEPRLVRGAVVVADNTGPRFRRAVTPYLRYVRSSPRWESREHVFTDDAMEVSVFRG